MLSAQCFDTVGAATSLPVGIPSSA